MNPADVVPIKTVTYLGTLHNLECRRMEIRWQIRLVVKAARLEGCTWAQIGAALGVSPQSAWQTYHHKEAVEVKT